MARIDTKLAEQREKDIRACMDAKAETQIGGVFPGGYNVQIKKGVVRINFSTT